jgi:hypothetical protein
MYKQNSDLDEKNVHHSRTKQWQRSPPASFATNIYQRASLSQPLSQERKCSSNLLAGHMLTICCLGFSKVALYVCDMCAKVVCKLKLWRHLMPYPYIPAWFTTKKLVIAHHLQLNCSGDS